ncbi:ribonuclease H-like domain-containing protein [Tanacetum coccineum]
MAWRTLWFEDPYDLPIYDVSHYIHGNTSGTTTRNPHPLTREELKVDKIVLSCIFSTLSDALKKWLVIARPKSANEAWVFISDIVKDNKRSCTSALKAELRSITLGDLTIKAYFQNIESLMTILASLDSPINDEDIVHYALAGLPDKYDKVCGYMHYKDTYPDLKTMRTLLVTEEMRLKSKAVALPMESSSHMALMTESGNLRCSSSTFQVKPRKPCFNFAKGTCQFEEGCHFVHDANMKNTSNHGVATKESKTDEILAKLWNAPSGSTPIPVGVIGTTSASKQATTLPNAFSVRTLHDPATGAWNMDTVTMESLVKIKQKGAILELKRRHLKNIIFCTHKLYPAKKIRRISASSAQETRNDQFPIRRIHYYLYAVCIVVHQSKIRIYYD